VRPWVYSPARQNKSRKGSILGQLCTAVSSMVLFMVLYEQEALGPGIRGVLDSCRASAPGGMCPWLSEPTFLTC
jgi:hypothetical protein